jgi:SNF2 family DNA or RNA helicase
MKVCLKTKPLEHQIKALKYLKKNKVGGLFMDMGLGKTFTAFLLIEQRQKNIDKVIWFCPVSLLKTFESELNKHLIEPDLYLFDYSKKPNRQYDWYGVGIESISSSNNVYFSISNLVTEKTFVIVDESLYIKTHNSKRTKRITELSSISRYRFILTGTPLSQGIVDLFSQMKFLSHKILGYRSFYSFANNHLEYSDKYPGLIVRSFNIDTLTNKIKPFIFQATKEEYVNLPDKNYINKIFDLEELQRKTYEIEKELALDKMCSCEEYMYSFYIFKLFSTLQKIVSGIYINEDGETVCFDNRFRMLKTITKEIKKTDKIIIFTKYLKCSEYIYNNLENCFLINGNIDHITRNTVIEKWKKNGRILVATYGVGGYGLNLTNASYCIFYDNKFKYSDRIQAENRIHRIGQKNEVFYISIWADCGIEDKISSNISKKRDTSETFRKVLEKCKNFDDIKKIVEEL